MKIRPLLDWPSALIALVSVAGAVEVYMKEGSAVFFTILADDSLLFLSILPKVAAGCLIGAAVRVLVPREVIVRFLGEGSGLRGLLLASTAGALFPAGPFTVFPLSAAFLVSGADRGAAIAFISGWLLLGLNRAIVWELPFFGLDFVTFRLLVSLPLPILAGAGARLLEKYVTAFRPGQAET